MTLQHELTTLPTDAITILRFVSNFRDTAIDRSKIQGGTGLSDRALSKGMKRLVTRYFMRMDEARFYYLMPKGEQAIELLMSDENLLGSDNDQINTIPYGLAVVLPRQVAPNQTTKWMLGVNPTSTEVLTYPAELFFRIRVNGGQVSPDETTLHLSPEQQEGFAQLTLTPNATRMRVEIEAFQLLDMDEPNRAGGMYFDVAVGNTDNQPRAVHTPISLL